VAPQVSSVVYQNGEFTAVANTIITSSDGIHWKTANLPVELDGDYSAITYANSMYVVVGEDRSDSRAVVLTSTDGKTWKSRTTGISGLSSDGQSLLDGVAWNGTRFVAMGTVLEGDAIQDIVITSVDGKSWSRATLPFGW
jgi:hypothetical protein